MGNSIHLFRVRGINIRMHITFPLILVWAALQFGLLSRQGLQGAIFGVVVTLILFVIVVLHELGHSLAALKYGVPVREIVLLPIGGVAQMTKMPERPLEEFVIAISGPMVNFAIAVLLIFVAVLSGINFGLDNLSLTLNRLLRASSQSIFAYVFISNIFLGVFNLLPAFPMDGGRILRALLATRMDHARATEIAVTIGQGLAWLMGLWGLLSGNLFVVVISIFILMGASQEGQMIRIRRAFNGLKVQDAYSRGVEILSPFSTLQDAVDLTLKTFQSDFPISENGNFLGLLSHSNLIDAINHHPPNTSVGEVMNADVPQVRSADGLFHVQQLLAESGLDALPVVDQGVFMGLITTRDLNEVYRLLSKRPDWSSMHQTP
jgi:Zn-dependent protease/predicted transcriptional regulator